MHTSFSTERFRWDVHIIICLSSGFQIASAKAAQHRLERGVWTSVRFGDMRRALSSMYYMHLLLKMVLNSIRFFFFLFMS